MTKERLEELLNECVNYICEIVNDGEEVREVFKHLGFTKSEMKEFDIIPDLPDEITISLDKLELDGPIDFTEGEINQHNNTDLYDAINQYLLETFGYFVNCYACDIQEGGNEVCVSDIDWDTTD